jgi:hypothetical protein
MLIELIIAVGCLALGYTTRWYTAKPTVETKIVKEVSTVQSIDKKIVTELVTWFEAETTKSENTLRRETKLLAAKLRGLL